MTVEESPTLSKYGRLRERYLREHKRLMYYTLLTSGKLYEHLAEIDTSARDMAEYLIKEMARKQGVTEELKARDMLRWVGKMNNIRACADEIVLNDIVYFPEVAKLFTEKVKQLFSFKEAQERAEKEAREKERQERIKARRNKRGMER